MKTHNKILFLSVVGIFLISSCTKQEEFIPSLHIVSFINPDDPFKVQVQKTAPTLGDHSNLTIDNAFIEIENSITQEIVKMFPQGDGIYTSDGRKPLPGFDYEVRISADGFPDATATAYVPDLGDVAIILDEAVIETNEVEFTFSPTMISSKPSSSNFFAYELVHDKPIGVGSEEEEQETGSGNAVNANGVGTEGIINTLRPVMQSVSEGSSVPIQAVNTTDGDIEEISVRIVAVSSDFHKYLVSKDEGKKYESSSVLLNNSRVYTNFVGNAHGIFGGFNEKTIKLVQ